jgi:DNA-binding transcriptional LysR family regulator
MANLTVLESFVATFEAGNFSSAARRLGLTPAAIRKNVARLESNLQLRLFQRSPRRFTLTDEGRQFFEAIATPFGQLQEAFIAAADGNGEPSGTLKVCVAHAFGRQYLVPLLGDFVSKFPAILPDWHFDDRPVDLIGGGFDVAIGGGTELNEGVVARQLAPAHVVVVASPSYMNGRRMPTHPRDLQECEGIARRSASTGRVYSWTLQTAAGDRAAPQQRTRMIFDDPDAIAVAAAQGLGIAMLPMPHAMPLIQTGALLRLLPGWFSDMGAISLYYPDRKLMPSRTRVFVDFIVDSFEAKGFRQLFTST